MSAIVVIGAGIVGLHVAAELRARGHEVYVLDRELCLAEHTSGRNSGVIHAGIFYGAGSLKERLCIAGNRLTYEWLAKLRVRHNPCGKWVLPGKDGGLDEFFEKARALPIPAPKMCGEDEVFAEEPALQRTRAVLIPSTGVLDAAEYVKTMARYVEAQGVTVVMNCRVTGSDGTRLETTRGEMACDIVVNSAGLFADEVAGFAGLSGVELKPCRGDYYVIDSCPLKRPAYHLPEKGGHGLGVHLTPTVAGELLLGPNDFFISDKCDYAHRTPPDDYRRAVASDLSGVSGRGLRAAYGGNRPKLFIAGKARTEFVIRKEGNWIHLLGIESPGLTAAPALAKEVAELC